MHTGAYVADSPEKRCEKSDDFNVEGWIGCPEACDMCEYYWYDNDNYSYDWYSYDWYTYDGGYECVDSSSWHEADRPSRGCAHLRANQIFNTTSMCAYSNVLTQALPPCFENSL